MWYGIQTEKSFKAAHFNSTRKQERKPYMLKNFVQKGDLNRHITSVHEGKRPYDCNICDKTFTQTSHLKQHIKGVHGGTD